MEDVKLQDFLKVQDDVFNGSGSGSGYGCGCGSGYGYGCGYGSGCGTGSGFGSGYSSGTGCGYGRGHGTGSGSGYGSGYDAGYGIKSICSKAVSIIDEVPTIIEQVHGNVAKGFILNGDFTLQSCYVVKGQDKFAHGNTLREAMQSLQDKLFEDMSEEERIDAFVKEHPALDKEYPNSDFFDWHNKLTGSCLPGREHFAKNKGIDLTASMTVRRFIHLTKNAYQGHIIKKLEQRYN